MTLTTVHVAAAKEEGLRERQKNCVGGNRTWRNSERRIEKVGMGETGRGFVFYRRWNQIP